ncbi:MAG: T9SS type A sorting domain-containing protein [Bacteroidales bacterium]|nr:T9SS type A sorting domain-containing protein [Bacteroidales bacterium]MCF8386394.1 T9SS type A sorting domain-containing protein [Bacteroidales bacterium]MCF8397884.1 T9SS type A sorting domain-containing protein [Bacteroidales bacterium]
MTSTPLSKIFLSSLFIIHFFVLKAQVHEDDYFNELFRSPCGGWIAGDATYSIELPDDKTLWLFGDSFIGTAMPDSSIALGAHMIRNCAVLQHGDSLQAFFNGTFEDPEDFVLTPQPDSSWFWPEHGILENDTLKIFMSEFIEGEGAPGWNFEYHNAYLVYFTYPGIELTKMELIPYYQQNEVRYGNQVLAGENYNYIYGRKSLSGNVPYIHIARVPVGNLGVDWEFYDGSSWTNDASQSARISFESVSQQYAVFSHQDKYVLLTQQIWLGAEIYTLTADQPEGPWDNKQHVYTTPYPFPDMFTYNAFAHPQFNENNELLVSYNSNGDFWEIFKNVELYRPKFIRIPFELIDTSFVNTLAEPIYDEMLISGIRNIPNPAGKETRISFNLREKVFISLHLYNSQGVELNTFINQSLPAGKHSFILNLRNLPPGIYHYRLKDKSSTLIHY